MAIFTSSKGKDLTILFLLLFFSSSWGGVSAEGRLSIQPIKKFGVTDLTQVNVIFNKTGINQETFSLFICDDKLPYPFKPNNNDTTKLIWNKVPLREPYCLPTRFRIKETNDNVTVTGGTRDELRHASIAPDRPDSKRIVRTASKPHFDTDKRHNSFWSKQSIEFLPSYCAERHECVWSWNLTASKPPTKSENATGNTCSHEFETNEKFNVQVIAKLGEKSRESAEINMSTADPECNDRKKTCDANDDELSIWMKNSIIIQEANRNDIEKNDTCVLGPESKSL